MAEHKNDDELSWEMRALLHELEWLIGASCYNDFIQNGPNGCSEGRDFRYPVTYTTVFKTTAKYRKVIPDDVCLGLPVVLDTQSMMSAHYAFGANQMHVFQGLLRGLRHIETKLNISFDEMLKTQAAKAKLAIDGAGSELQRPPTAGEHTGDQGG